MTFEEKIQKEEKAKELGESRKNFLWEYFPKF